MAITSPKRAKESEMESAARSWIARPILSSEFTSDPPLEDVYVGLLKQKKDISTAIQSVSSVLPGFSHLKRCSSNKLLLAPLKPSEPSQKASELLEEGTLTQEKLKRILKEKGFDLALLEDDFQVARVPARAAKTKAQAKQASKIWPLNFHPDPSVECLIDGSIFTRRQLQLIEKYMNVAIEAAKSEAVGDANCNGSAVIVDPEDGKILAIAASKMEQHPLWHAAMLAVDLVARLQGGGAWKLLCTGYWTFLVREPCPLCAMALVHSRVSRIFYGTANRSTGVLGSRTVLHAVPGLNHRYQVWSGVLEEECEQALREIEQRNIN